MRKLTIILLIQIFLSANSFALAPSSVFQKQPVQTFWSNFPGNFLSGVGKGLAAYLALSSALPMAQAVVIPGEDVSTRCQIYDGIVHSSELRPHNITGLLPGDPLLMGIDAFQAGNYPLAESLFNQGGAPDSLYDLGLTKLVLGDEAGAISDLSWLLQTAPDDVNSICFRLEALIRDKQFETAKYEQRYVEGLPQEEAPSTINQYYDDMFQQRLEEVCSSGNVGSVKDFIVEELFQGYIPWAIKTNPIVNQFIGLNSSYVYLPEDEPMNQALASVAQSYAGQSSPILLQLVFDIHEKLGANYTSAGFTEDIHNPQYDSFHLRNAGSETRFSDNLLAMDFFAQKNYAKAIQFFTLSIINGNEEILLNRAIAYRNALDLEKAKQDIEEYCALYPEDPVGQKYKTWILNDYNSQKKEAPKTKKADLEPESANTGLAVGLGVGIPLGLFVLGIGGTAAYYYYRLQKQKEAIQAGQDIELTDVVTQGPMTQLSAESASARRPLPQPPVKPARVRKPLSQPPAVEPVNLFTYPSYFIKGSKYDSKKTRELLYMEKINPDGTYSELPAYTSKVKKNLSSILAIENVLSNLYGNFLQIPENTFISIVSGMDQFQETGRDDKNRKTIRLDQELFNLEKFGLAKKEFEILLKYLIQHGLLSLLMRDKKEKLTLEDETDIISQALTYLTQEELKLLKDIILRLEVNKTLKLLSDEIGPISFSSVVRKFRTDEFNIFAKAFVKAGRQA